MCDRLIGDHHETYGFSNDRFKIWINIVTPVATGENGFYTGQDEKKKFAEILKYFSDFSKNTYILMLTMRLYKLEWKLYIDRSTT